MRSHKLIWINIVHSRTGHQFLEEKISEHKSKKAPLTIWIRWTTKAQKQALFFIKKVMSRTEMILQAWIQHPVSRCVPPVSKRMAAINAWDSVVLLRFLSPSVKDWMKTGRKTKMPSTHTLWQVEVPQISILCMMFVSRLVMFHVWSSIEHNKPASVSGSLDPSILLNLRSLSLKRGQQRNCLVVQIPTPWNIFDIKFIISSHKWGRKYPLVISQSYEKLPLKVDIPMKLVIFHSCVSLPEGQHLWNHQAINFAASDLALLLSSVTEFSLGLVSWRWPWVKLLGSAFCGIWVAEFSHHVQVGIYQLEIGGGTPCQIVEKKNHGRIYL